jgi:diacylglycerol kinase family enzyme
MNKESAFIFINPAAGNGGGGAIERRLAAEMESDPLLRKKIVSVERTKADSQAMIGACRDAAEKGDLVVICGGDGTAHQILNLLQACSYKKSVSIYPLGTGNDLALNLNGRKVGAGGTGGSFMRFLEKVSENPDEITLDYFSLNGKLLFTNYISLGFDAYVIILYEKILSRLKTTPVVRLPFFKKAILFLLGLYAFVFYRGEIAAGPDGKPCASIIVSNLPTYAGGAIFSEGSSISDGRPEIAFLTKFDYVKLMINRFRRKRQIFDIGAKTIDTPVRVVIDEPLPVELDGDDCTEMFADCTEFEITHEGSWKVCR